ncbi:peptidyl-prolyl cis-trans isomerase D [Endobacter medicaginis]|uniref:Parvulin-like PPIase n=1 Tax=Endobacter medicaginis TaxID=1181271 RepID=A0A839URA8_9PROT|nr:peptidylprolyl isomerase [Endobacter medicaginis]MBB3172738.1 peptidyl-prolyl cis-trans isomerase D [Endobacter medicaginis]MCX5474345.1 SurA N-terminal domain-containing protein [Endobacter medicaginis]NVN31582.1 SurA N-terminal domain-containing protein [Endobacter medicaginis]
MLATLRRTIVDTWVGRVIAILFILAFAGWGIGDMLTNIFTPAGGGVARVDGTTIPVADFDRAYRQQLGQLARQRNTDPSSLDAPTRQLAARQAAEQLVSQAVVTQAARAKGLRVPDSALRDAIFAIPAFQGANGQFDRTVFNQKLAQIGMTEPVLLSLMREDLTAQALVGALQAGVMAPKPLIDNAFAYASATRTASFVTIAFPTPASIAAPDEATLKRWYDNHADQFRSPEYRRIQAVVLTPDTIARGMTIPDADIHRAYDMLSSRYILPARRTVDILIGQDQAKMASLAAAWKAGASFADIQKQAGDAAAPVSLSEAPESEFPSPEIGHAVFAASPNTVTGPVQTAGGWAVLKVSRVVAPQTTTFDQAKADLSAEIAKARAGSDLSARATKLQDAIAGGGLDAIPTEIGAAPLLGSLDAQGNTPEGEPAPLPGPDSLRQAIITKAFATKPGAPPSLEQVGNDGYFALSVESITPAAARSFEQAHDAVLASWREAEARRLANTQAAALFARAQGTDGHRPGIAQAINDSGMTGLSVQQSPPIGRNVPPAGVPAPLARIAFDIPVGQSTMVEDGHAFVVATITGAQQGDPQSDRLLYGQTRDALTRLMGEDVGASYVAWLRGRAKISINQKLVDSAAGQP